MKTLLQNFKKGPSVTFENKDSGWHETTFEELTTNINTSADGAFNFTPFSIPSIYSVFLRFDASVFDSNIDSGFKIKAVNDWRGLLAILALQKRLKLPVSYDKIQFDDWDHHPFVDAARNSTPTESNCLFKNFGYKIFYTVAFDDKPIALFSPTTLVCPSSEFQKNIKNVNWYDSENQKFKDMSTPGALTAVLSENDKKELVAWLEYLLSFMLQQTSVSSAQGTQNVENSAHLTRITDMLREYLSHLTQNPNYRLPENVSYSAKLVKDWGSTNTIVDPLVSQLQFGIANNNDVIGNEHAFSELLMVVTDAATAFKGCINSGCYPVINKEGSFAVLPASALLIKKLSDLYKEEDNAKVIDLLQNRVKVEFQAFSNTYTVTIDITSFGCSIPYENTYSANEVCYVDTLEIPYVKVWPNFMAYVPGSRNNVWKQYFTYMKEIGEQDVVMIDSVHGSLRNSRFIKAGDTNCDTYWRVAVSENFPDFLVMKNTDGVLLGAICIKPPKPVTLSESSAYVGLDFGTTNTNAYVRKDDGEPIPVVHSADNLLDVISIDGEYNSVVSEFVPFSTKSSIYQTIYQNFTFEDTDGRARKNRPLVEGHTYYPAKGDTLLFKEGGYVSNLKFGHHPLEAQAFLLQIAVQSVLTALKLGIRNVVFRLSYTSGMTVDERMQLENDYELVLRNVKSYVSEIDIIISKDDLITESYAAGRYFINALKEYNINMRNGFVCIDIGGGTTDISVWQNLKGGAVANDIPLEQAAVRIAGSKMLSDNILFDPRLVTDLFNDTRLQKETMTIKAAVAASSDSGKDLARSLLDDLLAKETSIINWTTIRQNLLAKQVRNKLVFYVASIFYCAAILVKESEQSKGFTITDDISFVFGGNGSKTFEWVELAGDANWMTKSGSSMNRALTNMVRCILDSEKDLKMIKSEYPKTEVAYGLATITKKISTQENPIIDRRKTVCGMSLEVLTKDFFEKLKEFLPDIYNTFFAKKDAESTVNSCVNWVMDSDLYEDDVLKDFTHVLARLVDSIKREG